MPQCQQGQKTTQIDRTSRDSLVLLFDASRTLLSRSWRVASTSTVHERASTTTVTPLGFFRLHSAQLATSRAWQSAPRAARTRLASSSAGSLALGHVDKRQDVNRAVLEYSRNLAPSQVSNIIQYH